MFDILPEYFANTWHILMRRSQHNIEGGAKVLQKKKESISGIFSTHTHSHTRAAM